MINIYHLEKFTIVRNALQSLLSADPKLNWVGDGSDMDIFIKKLPGLEVDILLLDADTCPDCIDFCNYLKTYYPQVKIIIHSPYKRADWLDKFLEAGIGGVVSKNSGVNELLIAIHTVYKGKPYVCSYISKEFNNINEYLENKNITLRPVSPGFTNRETEVMDLIAQGLSTKVIADKLFVSIKTIETHRKNLISKAQVKNTAELMAYISNEGLLFR
jgi:DNA-binding NarL/FixJ family response regulator